MSLNFRNNKTEDVKNEKPFNRSNYDRFIDEADESHSSFEEDSEAAEEEEEDASQANATVTEQPELATVESSSVRSPSTGSDHELNDQQIHYAIGNLYEKVFETAPNALKQQKMK